MRYYHKTAVLYKDQKGIQCIIFNKYFMSYRAKNYQKKETESEIEVTNNTRPSNNSKFFKLFG